MSRRQRLLWTVIASWNESGRAFVPQRRWAGKHRGCPAPAHSLREAFRTNDVGPSWQERSASLAPAYSAPPLPDGFTVCGFDIDAGFRARQEIAEGTVADSVSEVAAACRSVVPGSPGPGVAEGFSLGVQARMGDATPFIETTTTGDPDNADRCSTRLAERGHDFLDATLGGSSKLLDAGQAILIVGGDADAFRCCSREFCAPSENACSTWDRQAPASAASLS